MILFVCKAIKTQRTLEKQCLLLASVTSKSILPRKTNSTSLSLEALVTPIAFSDYSNRSNIFAIRFTTVSSGAFRALRSNTPQWWDQFSIFTSWTLISRRTRLTLLSYLDLVTNKIRNTVFQLTGRPDDPSNPLRPARPG